jgi:hypothetical protein
MGSDRFGWARIRGGNVAEEGKDMGAKRFGREEAMEPGREQGHGEKAKIEDEEDGGGMPIDTTVELRGQMKKWPPHPGPLLPGRRGRKSVVLHLGLLNLMVMIPIDPPGRS